MLLLDAGCLGAEIPPLKRQSPRSRGQAHEDREGVAHLLPPRCLQFFSVHGTDLLFTVEGLKSSTEGTYRTVSKALEMVACSEYKSDFLGEKVLSSADLLFSDNCILIFYGVSAFLYSQFLSQGSP